MMWQLIVAQFLLLFSAIASEKCPVSYYLKNSITLFISIQVDTYNTDFIKKRICDMCSDFIKTKEDTKWLSHNCKEKCYKNNDFTKCANLFTPFNQTINTSKDIDNLAQKYSPGEIMKSMMKKHCRRGKAGAGGKGRRGGKLPVDESKWCTLY